jgi:ABC-type nickel/cobalt efflux system permease component RcnA
VPLNWVAQAYGLSVATTWIVTAILLAASGGAIAGLGLTRHNRRRRGLLLTLIALTYLALVLLRTSFLVTVVRTSTIAATLQALLLGAISAGLLACAAAVIARTQPLRLDRAVADARRARRHAAASHNARLRAEEDAQRHWAALQRLLREWSITSDIPANASQADIVNALERALRALIPQG